MEERSHSSSLFINLLRETKEENLTGKLLLELVLPPKVLAVMGPQQTWAVSPMGTAPQLWRPPLFPSALSSEVYFRSCYWNSTTFLHSILRRPSNSSGQVLSSVKYASSSQKNAYSSLNCKQRWITLLPRSTSNHPSLLLGEGLFFLPFTHPDRIQSPFSLSHFSSPVWSSCESPISSFKGKDAASSPRYATHSHPWWVPRRSGTTSILAKNISSWNLNFFSSFSIFIV